MENFEPPSSDMYVTPHRPYSGNLPTPTRNDQRCFHEKVDVAKRPVARKKLLSIFQNPMFPQGSSSQGPYRPWNENSQAFPEKAKEDARKISPYMRNKLSGKFHNMKQSSPKVINKSFYKILINI